MQPIRTEAPVNSQTDLLPRVGLPSGPVVLKIVVSNCRPGSMPWV